MVKLLAKEMVVLTHLIPMGMVVVSVKQKTSNTGGCKYNLEKNSRESIPVKIPCVRTGREVELWKAKGCK